MINYRSVVFLALLTLTSIGSLASACIDGVLHRETYVIGITNNGFHYLDSFVNPQTRLSTCEGGEAPTEPRPMEPDFCLVVMPTHRGLPSPSV